ncbi:MAG: carbohydrate ABC transporter permease, partial [Devosiaceae bacterium]
MATIDTSDTTVVRASSAALLEGNRAKQRRSWGQFIRWTLLFIGGVLMVMPLAYMISTSLKWPFEVYDVSLIPQEPHLENYSFVLEDGRFYSWFINSMVIATITTISSVFFDSLIGYTLCKFRFRGRYIIFIAILSTLMIPTEMLVIPWYLMSQSFGWLDSYW